VQCQLDLLEEDFFEHEIKRTLTSLPTGLYQTYDKILERITRPSKTDRILRILTSLAFSIRPLTICEIENVLRITPQEKVRLHEQDSPANKEHLVRRIIQKTCGSFVTLEPSSKSSSNEEVTLAHFSVKEYLVSSHLKHEAFPTVLRTFALPHGKGHRIMGEICCSSPPERLPNFQA
jgi:ankyrin repeat domain-containing protein 50